MIDKDENSDSEAEESDSVDNYEMNNERIEDNRNGSNDTNKLDIEIKQIVYCNTLLLFWLEQVKMNEEPLRKEAEMLKEAHKKRQ